MSEGWRLNGRLRPLSAAGTAILVLALGRACFIGIAEPRADRDDAGSGGSAGTGGAGSGGAPGGVGGAAGEAGLSCDGGEKICGGCVAIDDPDFGCGPSTCTPCEMPDGGISVSCEAGECVVTCAPDLVACGAKCYGPAASDLPPPASIDAMDIPAIPLLSAEPSLDGDITDWPDSVPLVRMATACTNCGTAPVIQPGGQPGERLEFAGEVPSSTDLAPYFLVAWNQAALFVAVIVKDNETLAERADAGAGGDVSVPRTSAERQDGVELFVVGSGLTSDLAHHLFIGLNHEVSRPNQELPTGTQFSMGSAQLSRCYVMETKLSWNYLRQGSSPISPSPGQTILFDVAVNDWDTFQDVPRREHQLFWKHPGPNYTFNTSGYPRAILE